MIVGQMALYNHPMWRMTLAALLTHVDKVYLRWDQAGLDTNIAGGSRISDAQILCGPKFGGLLISATPWRPTNWREEMLRLLDTVKPSIVLAPDEDEVFGEGIEDDIETLRRSKHSQMAFEYVVPMPTNDGFDTGPKPYPSKSHVKAFRWKPGLTYLPYKRRARLANYSKTAFVLGKSKILHYAFYTEEMRKTHLTTAKAKMEAQR
jgi:hypothetical protein